MILRSLVRTGTDRPLLVLGVCKRGQSGLGLGGARA